MKAQLLIADLFEPLANGKILAVGLYPDGIIMFESSPSSRPGARAVSSLGFMVVLTECAPGPITAVADVLLPSGAPHPHLKQAQIGGAVSAAGSLNMVLNAPHLVLPEDGTYHMRFQVGGQAFDLPFTVRTKP